MQATIVHRIRDNRPDQWFVIDSAGNIVSPVCDSLEQLRIAESVIDLAFDMPYLEVRE